MEKQSMRPEIIKVEKPHTILEMEADAKKRLSLINKEFSEGLKFIRKFTKSVTIFGSSLLSEQSPHYEHAKKLAYRLSKEGYAVVTGGGPGIMEAANRGACDAGGQSVGLNIKLPHEQKKNDYVTDFHEFYYFFSRKVALTFAAEAYVFFPGGFGTLNEFFEIIMLIQTRRLEPVPIILVGSDYWKPLDAFIREHLSEKQKMVEKGALQIYTVCDDDEKIVGLVKKTPVIETVPFPKR